MASAMGIGLGRSWREPAATRGMNVRPIRAYPDPLGGLIENEVIPRLLVAHSDPLPILPGGPTAISSGEVERFAPLVLASSADVVLDEVEIYLRRGVPIETLFVELLAPAARLLGEGWVDDRLDFIEVTMGLWRLQEVLREIAARAPRALQAGRIVRTALFAAMPGDQHTFGAAMIEQCFARAGWETDLLVEDSRRKLLAMVAAKDFDLIGLTLSRDCLTDRLPSMVTALRSVSRNPDVRIMLGGRVLTLNPSLVAFAGADGTAPTAVAAVSAAAALFETLPCAVPA